MKGAWGPFKPPSLLPPPPPSSSSVLSRPTLLLLLRPCRATAPFRSRSSRAFSSGARRLQSGSAKESIGAGFSYKIAAAFTGKSNVFDRNKHHYQFDSETGVGRYADPTLTQKGRKLPSGQDSFFICNVGDSSAAAFGVADGVGGYKDAGIDSADFAHGICRYMRHVADDFGKGKAARTRLSPQQLLQSGYNLLCHDESITGGGSTACVAVADGDGTLNVANLGDSGFVQLRLNAVHYYSDPQTHAFNTPFQLSTVPPRILAQLEHTGGTLPFRDMPRDASNTSHTLKHGDVLVFATDGLWDNLSSQDVLDRVSTVMLNKGAWTLPEGEGVQVSKTLPYLADEEALAQHAPTQPPLHTALALDIATKAKAASVNLKRDGPFAKAVQQQFPREQWHGGKVDDICVVVAVVVDQDAV